MPAAVLRLPGSNSWASVSRTGLALIVMKAPIASATNPIDPGEKTMAMYSKGPVSAWEINIVFRRPN